MTNTLPCPFCGQQPQFRTKLSGCRDDPYRVYTIHCPDNHAQFSCTLTDKEERIAYDLTYRKPFNVQASQYHTHYWTLAKPQLLSLWNTRT